MQITIESLAGNEDLGLPTYATSGSSGLDLRAAIPAARPVQPGLIFLPPPAKPGRIKAIETTNPSGVLVLMPGQYTLIPCGFRLAMPLELEAQVRPRSGLALKHGITVLNTPGTIDSDYSGEIGAILINYGTAPFEIRRGDRIAQLVFARVERVDLAAGAVSESGSRGSGGFGSTGTA